MPKASKTRSSRFVGGYFLFIGILVVGLGILLRYFLWGMEGLFVAGAGSSPEELESFARQANWFCYPLMALGAGLAAFGIYRLVRPHQIRQDP